MGGDMLLYSAPPGRALAARCRFQTLTSTNLVWDVTYVTLKVFFETNVHAKLQAAIPPNATAIAKCLATQETVIAATKAAAATVGADATNVTTALPRTKA